MADAIIAGGIVELVSALLFFGAGVLGVRNYWISAGITNYWMLFSVGMITAAVSMFTLGLTAYGLLPEVDLFLPSLLTSAHTAIVLSALDMLTSNIKRTAA